MWNNVHLMSHDSKILLGKYLINYLISDTVKVDTIGDEKSLRLLISFWDIFQINV